MKARTALIASLALTVSLSACGSTAPKHNASSYVAPSVTTTQTVVPTAPVAPAVQAPTGGEGYWLEPNPEMEGGWELMSGPYSLMTVPGSVPVPAPAN